jgi:hypothetical protein
MPLDPCPRCGIAVHTMNLSDRDIAVEPQLDLDVDSPEVLRWIPHSESVLVRGADSRELQLRRSHFCTSMTSKSGPFRR